MATDDMLLKPTVKVGKVEIPHEEKKRDSDFLITTKSAAIKTTRENNWNGICLVWETANRFPPEWDSIIRSKASDLYSQASKKPETLDNIKSIVSGGQFDKQKKDNAIYSIKLEVDKTTPTLKITMCAGKDFTELYLEQNGKLVEILRQEKGEATHERFSA